jgi:SAM-dependent MidA family methyltransferase
MSHPLFDALFDVAKRGLPTPEAPLRMHGEAVALAIAAKIAASPSHSISFTDFMRACLYEPNLGYYTAGATKLGDAGDFTTAPEMTPLFGATLATAFAPLIEHGVLELGAGSGALANSFINVVDSCDYRILEVSADLRERQQRALTHTRAQWLDTLPEEIAGVVLLNEVLDAVPCEIVRFNDSRYAQAFVKRNVSGFDFDWQPVASGALLDAAKHRVPPIEGYTSEINLEAEALAATLASRLSDTKPAAICFIDYGFPRREFYTPSRMRGTLMCHYRHRAHSDPLVLPGLQDITSHIDFTAIAEAAVDAGAQVIGYATQAKFLLANGLLDRLQAATFSNESERIAVNGAVQKLLSPTEMGELFKVLVVGNEAAATPLERFVGIDESYRL